MPVYQLSQAGVYVAADIFARYVFPQPTRLLLPSPAAAAYHK